MQNQTHLKVFSPTDLK